MEVSSLPPGVHESRLGVFSTHLRFSSDEQLVDLFRDGRDEAFRVIHDRYRARLHAYVRQMLSGRSSEDVEDLLQEVFERAARTLRSGPAPLGLRAWLYSVARNRCIDELRRRPPASPDVLAASRLPSGDTTAVAERRADVERLFSDLRALPELQRSALLMRELQGLSHVELAVVLDATVPAVKSLLVRARVGLVDAEEARGVPCASVRNDLASAYDRRVKASAQASRHLRECAACSTYRAELRLTSRRIAGLIPGPALLPLGLLGRLFGRSVGHIKAPALAGTLASTGGPVVAGAGKMAAILSVATVATAGVAIERDGGMGGVMPWSSPTTVHGAPLAGGGVGLGRVHMFQPGSILNAAIGLPARRAGTSLRAAGGGPFASIGTPPPTSGAQSQVNLTTTVSGTSTPSGGPAVSPILGGAPSLATSPMGGASAPAGSQAGPTPVPTTLGPSGGQGVAVTNSGLAASSVNQASGTGAVPAASQTTTTPTAPPASAAVTPAPAPTPTPAPAPAPTPTPAPAASAAVPTPAPASGTTPPPATGSPAAVPASQPAASPPPASPPAATPASSNAGPSAHPVGQVLSTVLHP